MTYVEQFELQPVVFKGDKDIESKLFVSVKSLETTNDKYRAIIFYLAERYNNALRVLATKNQKDLIAGELRKRGDAYRKYSGLMGMKALDQNNESLQVLTSDGFYK